MCGIAGAVGMIDKRIIDAVRAADGSQIHRGPDAHGLWTSGDSGDACGAVLAHRRLSILDPTPAGAQPMVHEASGTALVFNGEIYNYRDIRTDLEHAGFTFHSDCDTEVVLNAYVHWGMACVQRFRGMFALAIWDSSKRELHLARDRIGIKPLYLMQAGETILFASELRSLLATGLNPRTLDPVGLATYLWNGFVFGPNTIVRGISLLPAGTMLALRSGEEMGEPETYWRLPQASAGQTTLAEMQHTLETAVNMRLIADVPLGVFLSGGIDSSAVAALAVKSTGQRIHTFNIGFEQPEYDESPFARRVANALGTQHTCITLTEDDFKAQLDAALDAIDQPTFDGINTYLVSKAVRQAGMTVALAGTGGDEIFGGYSSFRDVPRAAAWGRRAAYLPTAPIRAAAALATRWKTGRPGEIPPQTRWGKLVDVLDARGDVLETYQVAYSLFTRRFIDELNASPPGDTRFGLPMDRAQSLARAIDGSPPLHAISMLETACFLGERLMRDTDAASMAVSLEARVPLLDHQVVETASCLRAEDRFNPLGRKQILRDLALRELDPSLFERPKSGFVLPIDTWCRQSLNARMDAVFHEKSGWSGIGINPSAAGALWRSFTAGAPGIYWSRVWSLFVLNRWCEQHQVTQA